MRRKRSSLSGSSCSGGGEPDQAGRQVGDRRGRGEATVHIHPHGVDRVTRAGQGVQEPTRAGEIRVDGTVGGVGGSFCVGPSGYSYGGSAGLVVTFDGSVNHGWSGAHSYCAGGSVSAGFGLYGGARGGVCTDQAGHNTVYQGGTIGGGLGVNGLASVGLGLQVQRMTPLEAFYSNYHGWGW